MLILAAPRSLLQGRIQPEIFLGEKAVLWGYPALSPPPQQVAFFSPAFQAAFGLELNALSDDQTPLPNAVTKIMEGLNKARDPFIRVCTPLTSVPSPHIQLLLLEFMDLCPYVSGKQSSVDLSLQWASR